MIKRHKYELSLYRMARDYACFSGLDTFLHGIHTLFKFGSDQYLQYAGLPGLSGQSSP